MSDVDYTSQYWWSFGNEALRIGKEEETRRFSSSLKPLSVNITCMIYAQADNKSVSGSISVMASFGKNISGIII